MFGEKWEPAVGMLLSTHYGGKHGDWSGNASTTANSVHYLMEVGRCPPEHFGASANRQACCAVLPTSWPSWQSYTSKGLLTHGGIQAAKARVIARG